MSSNDTSTLIPFPNNCSTCGVSSSDVGISFAIFFSLGLVTVTVYSILRYSSRNLYSLRNRWVSPDEHVPEPPRGFISWLFPLLHPYHCDDLILKHVGLDAYVSVRFLKLGLKYLGFMSVFGGVLLFPYYAVLGNTISNLASSPFSLEILSMRNISEPGSPTSYLWLPCIMAYIYTVVGLLLLHSEYLHILPIQRRFYLNSHRSTYTVLVERLPYELNTRYALMRYFESLYPGAVERINLVVSNNTAKELAKTSRERERVVRAIERDNLLEYKEKKRQQNYVENNDAGNEDWHRKIIVYNKKSQNWMGSRPFCYGILCRVFRQGHYTNALDYNETRLEELNRKIMGLKHTLLQETTFYMDTENSKDSHFLSPLAGDEPIVDGECIYSNTDKLKHDFEIADNDEIEIDHSRIDDAEWLLGDHAYDAKKTNGINAAFVTFNNKMSSVAVARCMRSEKLHFTISPAPVPNELNWGALAMNPIVLLISRTGVVLLNILLLILFGAMTSFISATTKITFLRSRLPWLDIALTKYPILINVWSQLGPLILVILFAIVPPILNLILTLRFKYARTDHENSFFVNYYVFLVTQLFLFFQISGAIVSLNELSLTNVNAVIEVFAYTILSNAMFFMQFIIIRTFWVLPAQLARIPALAVAVLIRPIFCKPARTPRELRDETCGCRTYILPGDAWYGFNNASAMLTFSIGIAYSVLSPLCTMITFVYFAFALIIWRNQSLYVYVKIYESGGKNWPYIAYIYLFSMVVFQFIMLSVFAILSAPSQSVLMLIPLISTISYASFINSHYEKKQFSVSLSDARRFDLKNKSSDKQEPHDYKAPGLRIPQNMEPTPVPTMVNELDRLYKRAPSIDEDISL